MGYVIYRFSIHLIDILKKLSHDEIEAFMYQDEPVELKLQNMLTNLADCFNLNEQLPLQFLDNVKVGKIIFMLLWKSLQQQSYMFRMLLYLV